MPGQVAFMHPLHDDNEDTVVLIIQTRLHQFVPEAQEFFPEQHHSRRRWHGTLCGSSKTMMSPPSPVIVPPSDVERRWPPARLSTADF